MPRDGSGVFFYSLSSVLANTTILSSQYNGDRSELLADLNTPRPIIVGGTGASNVTGARTNLGVPGLTVPNNLTGTNTFTGAVDTTGGTLSVADATDDAHAVGRLYGDGRYLQAANEWSLKSGYPATFVGGSSHAVAWTVGQSSIRIRIIGALDFADGADSLEVDIGSTAQTITSTNIDPNSSANDEMFILELELIKGEIPKDSNPDPVWGVLCKYSIAYNDNNTSMVADSGVLAFRGTVGNEPVAVNIGTVGSGTFIDDTGAVNTVTVWERA